MTDAAQDTDVTAAYNTCMTTEPDEADKAVKGKLQKANEDLQAATTLAANEKTAKETEAKKAADLLKRAELAEGAFANERNAHIDTIITDAILLGKITKAEGETHKTTMANAKNPTEFDAAVKNVVNAKAKAGSEKILSANLERTIAPGTASHKFQTMVNEAVEKDTTKRADKWGFHWAACSKTDAGKALLAEMRQPAKYEEQIKKAA
jgi:hypothetical protein